MSYSMHLLLTLATILLPKTPVAVDESEADPVSPDLTEVSAPALQRLRDLAEDFRRQPVSPTRTHRFEQQLQETLRELGRGIVQHTYNHLEPLADLQALAKHVHFEAGLYTRLNAKTPQHAWTLFGQIRLWRVGYRPTDQSGEPTIFPLALSLGLVQGASPALAERAAYFLGATGMSQGQTLQRLRQDHGVGWGVKKLRQVADAVSQALTAQRHETQVEKLLELLRQASATTGRHKPVLSVGRDGITLGVRLKRGNLFEVATTGTVSVLDRRGRRLGTVYLAYTPEAQQVTMSRELTRLLHEVLQRWQGPLPRLCYVTDAGDNETTYYDKVLARMKHPCTGAKLDWIRVVDYYHASERIGTLAALLFGKGQQSVAWVRKMQKWLLKPGGVNRVLHSAAALRDQYGLKGTKRAAFQKAYRYLRVRMKYMQYAAYRRVGVPLGSGVTEAACKTVYTQRLKLSGMRWQKAGAQTILNLRVLQLSGVWDDAYARALQEYKEPKVEDQRVAGKNTGKKAA
jgi:hypothetical protein